MHKQACRCGIVAFLVMLGSTWLAVPARADTGPPGRRSALTTVSAKTLEKLREQPAKTSRVSQSGSASEPAFFKTRKGAIAVGLMAAGAAFTVWSVNHDRKPVKSPIR
ncbi:MAG: hypothetical protein ABIX28_01660 [Vicinamibacterales bacterium]